MRRKILFILAIILIVLFGFVTEDFIKSSIGKAALGAKSKVVVKQIPQIMEEAEEIKADFIVTPTLIKAALKEGETKKEVVEVINIGDIALGINLELGSLRRFVNASEVSFMLEPGKVKKIELDISGKVSGVYSGIIVFKGDGIERIVKLVIEVKELKALLDVTTKVVEKVYKPGEDVRANIEIINLGDLEKMNVLLYYALKSFDGDVLTFKEERVEIAKKLVIERSLSIPSGSVGDFIFYSKVFYEDNEAASADVFEVTREEVPAPVEKEWLNIIFLLVIGILIVTLLALYVRDKIKESHGVYVKIKRK